MKALRVVFVLCVGLIGLSLTAAEEPKAGLPQIEKREIAVMGAVVKEGKQTLPTESGTDQTLIAAITRAGGFTRYAEIREVRVVRRNARGEFEQSFTVDVSEQLKGKAFELRPGDVLSRPRTRLKSRAGFCVWLHPARGDSRRHARQVSAGCVSPAVR